LVACIAERQPWAVQLALKTLGKDRGYTEAIEHKGGGKLVVYEEIVEVSPRPEALPVQAPTAEPGQ
ncbi:MAG: hypothetical protein WCK82_08390, partial [Bacteroidota bacterium]